MISGIGCLVQGHVAVLVFCPAEQRHSCANNSASAHIQNIMFKPPGYSVDFPDVQKKKKRKHTKKILIMFHFSYNMQQLIFLDSCGMGTITEARNEVDLTHTSPDFSFKITL